MVGPGHCGSDSWDRPALVESRTRSVVRWFEPPRTIAFDRSRTALSAYMASASRAKPGSAELRPASRLKEHDAKPERCRNRTAGGSHQARNRRAHRRGDTAAGADRPRDRARQACHRQAARDPFARRVDPLDLVEGGPPWSCVRHRPARHRPGPGVARGDRDGPNDGDERLVRRALASGLGSRGRACCRNDCRPRWFAVGRAIRNAARRAIGSALPIDARLRSGRLPWDGRMRAGGGRRRAMCSAPHCAYSVGANWNEPMMASASDGSSGFSGSP